MEMPALVTLIVLLEYLYFALQVGLGRTKYGVEAPAMSGNETWERYYRVQQNTLEQLIVFIPALWVFSYFVSPVYGAAIGLLFVVARPIYYIRYIKEPRSRGRGFLPGYLANLLLLIGGIAGAVYSLI